MRTRWLITPLIAVLVGLGLVVTPTPALAVTDGTLTVNPATLTPSVGIETQINVTFAQGSTGTTDDIIIFIKFPEDTSYIDWKPNEFGSCTGYAPALCGVNGSNFLVRLSGGVAANQTVNVAAPFTALTGRVMLVTIEWWKSDFPSPSDMHTVPGSFTLSPISTSNASVVVAANSNLLSRVVDYTVTVTKVSGVNASGTAIIAFPSAFPSISGDCSITARIAVCPFSGLSTSVDYHFTGTVDTLYVGAFTAQAVLINLTNYDNNAADNAAEHDCTAVSALVITC